MVFKLFAYSGPEPARLTDEVILHLQALSFFLFLALLCAKGLQGFWNLLHKNNSVLPALGFLRSFAVTLLLGVLLLGFSFSLQPALKTLTPDLFRQPDSYVQRDLPPDLLPQRRDGLNQLARALLLYATRHAGKYPPQKSDVKSDLWHSADPSGLDYQYTLGCSVNDGERILVYEPDIFNGIQLRLLANGDIREVQIRTAPPPSTGGK